MDTAAPAAPAAKTPTDSMMGTDEMPRHPNKLIEPIRYFLYVACVAFGLMSWVGMAADGNRFFCAIFGNLRPGDTIVIAEDGELANSFDFCGVHIALGAIMTGVLVALIFWHTTYYLGWRGLPYSVETSVVGFMAVLWTILASAAFVQTTEGLGGLREVQVVVIGAFIAAGMHLLLAGLAAGQWWQKSSRARSGASPVA